MFAEGNLIAQARRHFKPVGFPMWECRKPSKLSCGLEGCGKSLIHSELGTESSTVLHFHLTFQTQDGGRRKGAGLFCTVAE